VHDRLIARELLTLAPPDAALIDVGKSPGASKAQSEINAQLIELGRTGRTVVRLKGGDPFVFGRGGEEAEALRAAAIRFEVVPGVSSAFAAPAAAGIPVTHRGLAHEFVVVSGHLPPGHPDSLVDWAALARLRGTLCVLMGLSNLDAIAAALVAHGRPGTTPVAVVQDGTTATQRVRYGTLAGIAADSRRDGLRPPAVVVIGPVVAALGAPR